MWRIEAGNDRKYLLNKTNKLLASCFVFVQELNSGPNAYLKAVLYAYALLQDSDTLQNLQEKKILKSLYHLYCVVLAIVPGKRCSGTSWGHADDVILPYMDMYLIT